MTALPPDNPPRVAAETTPDASKAPPTESVASPPERRRGAERRSGVERRQRDVPVAVERRSGVDRRAIADRRAAQRGGQYELDADALEFIRAIQAFKEHTGKAFPTWSDVLGILTDLGYEKRR